jgi:hypothetical protein
MICSLSPLSLWQFSRLAFGAPPPSFWKAGEVQTGLARDAFIATHRPRIVVRRMGVELTKNAPIIVEFSIVNIGEEKVTK